LITKDPWTIRRIPQRPGNNPTGNEQPRGKPRGIKESNPQELRSKPRGIHHPAKAG
jgi:hypothetical protein